MEGSRTPLISGARLIIPHLLHVGIESGVVYLEAHSLMSDRAQSHVILIPKPLDSKLIRNPTTVTILLFQILESRMRAFCYL